MIFCCFSLLCFVAKKKKKNIPKKSNKKKRGVALSLIANRLAAAIVSMSYLSIVNVIGGYTWFIFGFFCILALLFTIFFIPETKGISLEGITDILANMENEQTQNTQTNIKNTQNIQQQTHSHLTDMVKTFENTQKDVPPLSNHTQTTQTHSNV